MKEKLTQIALVPEDRRQQGLFMVAGVNRNISMESFARLTGRFFINFKKERALTDEWRENLSIKYENQADPVDRLSGGNQQKTVLAKWLATNPDLRHLSVRTIPGRHIPTLIGMLEKRVCNFAKIFASHSHKLV